MRLHAVVLLLACGLPTRAPAAAQERHQVTLEASVFRGTLGYAARAGRALHLGGELGFGFPQTDLTLMPSAAGGEEPRLREYLHGALFLRHRVARALAYDAGVRAAVVDLWPCRASDCWPTSFLGGYLQPMLGGRRISVGPRLVAGWVGESRTGGGSTFTAGIAPVNVRLTLGW